MDIFTRFFRRRATRPVAPSFSQRRTIRRETIKSLLAQQATADNSIPRGLITNLARLEGVSVGYVSRIANEAGYHVRGKEG